MKKCILFLVFLSTLALGWAHSATALPTNPPQTVDVGGRFVVNPGETQTVSLAGPMYIKNLVIQAQGSAFESTIEVMVNGEVKGTIHAPGRDPSYVVTVAETTRSIQFRHRDGGSMQILDISATAYPLGSPPIHPGLFIGSSDQVIELASRALREIQYLKGFATPEEQAMYLYPIKRNAGLVYVMATAHGDLSSSTTTRLVALADQISFAEPYLNELMMTESAFDGVVELIAIREKIRALLN